MFKPIRWKTFARDLFIIQIGFALFGLSIALMIRGHLGTTPWAVLEVALSQISGIRPGRMSIIVGFSVLLIALAFRERIGWGTLTNIVFIGLWEDLFLGFIPDVSGQPATQWAMLLGATLLMGVASAVYIGVDAGAGPRDSLMLAVHRVSRLSLRVARGGIELTVFLLGWLLGGPAGIGTLVFALLIGPAVQGSFRLFNVRPHRSLEEASAE